MYELRFLHTHFLLCFAKTWRTKPTMTTTSTVRISRRIDFCIDLFALTTNRGEAKALVRYVVSALIASFAPRFTYNFLASVWGLFRYLTQPERRRWSRAGQKLVSRGKLGPIKLEIRNLAAFKSYVKFWIELLAVPLASPERIGLDLTIEGDEPLRKSLATGKGAIVATGHIGNPDWGAFVLSAYVNPVATVVAPLKPPILEKWFVFVRSLRGLETILLKGPVTKQILDGLNSGKLIAMACDYDMSGTAMEVSFFSKQLPISSGPATLALRTNTPIYPAACFMTQSGGHLAKIMGPIFPEDAVGTSVREKILYLTQEIAKSLELLVSSAPEQWHVVISLPIPD